jgi:hypothetical protein
MPAIEEQTPDIKAWAAIDEIDEDVAIPRVPAMAVEQSFGAQCKLFDSGASSHMSLFHKQFVNYHQIPARPIAPADDKIFPAIGMGDLEIQVPNGAIMSTILLKDTLFALDLHLTLVSTGCILKEGYKLEFVDNACYIREYKNGPIISHIPVSASCLFKVEHTSAADDASKLAEPVDILTLRCRLGHISVDIIHNLIHAGSITGLQVIDNFPPFICDLCEYAKTTRKLIPKERTTKQAQIFGEDIHTDIWEPSPTLSLGSRKYYVTFTDDSTRYTQLQVLWTKDEAFKADKSFLAWVQTQHSTCIKQLRSDRGGEFTGNDFTSYLQQLGTEHRLTTRDTPQHNGVAESLNCRLMEQVRAIQHQADLPKSLWAEAILHAVWLKNHTSIKVLDAMMPYKKLYKQKPNLANVPEWGQSVWIYNSDGPKLDAQAKQAQWVGYDTDSIHTHRVYWPGKNSITIEPNVKFISPTIIVNTQPPSYASTMAPQQAPPPSPLHSPSASSQASSPVFHLPTGSPPFSTPPSMLITDTHADEDKVEQTITPRHVRVPTTVNSVITHTSPWTQKSMGFCRVWDPREVT